MKLRYDLLFFLGLSCMMFVAPLWAEPTLRGRMFAIQKEESRSRDLEIVHVENDHSAFAVHVDVDRRDRVYREGETLVTTVKSSRDGYLYMIHISASGKETLLIPNKYQPDNTIRANRSVSFPDENSDFQFRVSSPFGRETIKAFVTTKPLHSIGKTRFTQSAVTGLDGTTSRSIAQELNKRSKDIVIEGKPTENDFATHEVKYMSQAKSLRTSRTKGENRYAVCIGIEKYEDSKIRALSVCASDAKAMAKLFQQHCGVEPDNCLMLTNEEATQKNLRRLFCEILPELVKPDDVVFCYWSGHGGRMAAVAGSSSTTGYSQYLVPHDGKLNSPAATMLLDDQFGHWLQKLDGCKIFFALDACHSGGMTIRAKNIFAIPDTKEDVKPQANSLVGRFRDTDARSKSVGEIPVKDNENFTDFTFGFTSLQRSKAIGQKGVAVLASSSYNQLSFEREEEDLSIMTYYLIKTIVEGPDTMTHKDLKTKIRAGVDDYIKRNRPNTKQTVVEQDDLMPGLVLKRPK